MTLTQQFIRNNGLDAITERYAIKVKRHPQFPSLAFLKYDQIESPMSEPMVQECRGLMLDEADDWRIVSYPFRKFFNAHEGHAATIDWATARVYEKLDGSLMTLYWYAGEWRVASNGTPDAGGPVYGHKGTFAELFWETFNALGYRLPTGDDDDPVCHMFEMMTPFNRVVVPHAAPRLVLIGVRTLNDLKEHRVDDVGADALGWDVVQSHPLTTVADCIAAAEKINPMESEGYVVCDADFNRIKVKCPQYVALAHIKESMSERAMLDVIRKNEGDEFLGYFPEMKPLYGAVKEKYERLAAETEWHFSRLGGIADSKAFALEATKTPYSSALFAVRNGKAGSVRSFYADCSTQLIERALAELK